MKTILVDMDNTIADYSTPIAEALAPHVKDYKITPENWSECVSDKSLKKIQYKKQSEPNFFRTLKPIEGALEALNEMEELGFNVFIVSSPCVGNSTCHSDKSEWLKEYMGDKWARKLVLTKDKTIVRGDVLIDDREDVIGSMQPVWEHVIYSQPYNKHISDERKRLCCWKDWKSIIQ